MSPQLEIQIIAMIVAVGCSIPGVFLVLRGMAMMTDAITHTILLGIVIGFMAVGDLSSPFLVAGAVATGLLTVYLVEMLTKTRLMSEDSAIGIVFPLMFSAAIILISRYAGKAHIDTDSVLLGELAFAPFNRLIVGGADLGAKSMYTMGAILAVNLAGVLFFYKELKLTVFDPALAAVLGFSPALVQYGLMTSVSLTTVGAFEAVGSILVIAFMIGPPITAYLLTDDLRRMLLLSAAVGGLNALVGYRIAAVLDVSIAGSMALVTGLVFLMTFVFAPQRGMLTVARMRRERRVEFAKNSILFHILNHEGEPNESTESGVATIRHHLNIEANLFRRLIAELIRTGLLCEDSGVYRLTDKGRVHASATYTETFG